MATISNDELLLARMGYRQEFTRSFGFIHNFGVSISHITILATITLLFGFSLVTGGAGGAIWSWVFVSILTMAVAATMAEICSAYPTAGGLYYWSAKLGGSYYGPVFAWFTGWFNFLGEIGGIASGGYGMGQQVFAIVVLNNPDFVLQTWHIPLLGIALVYFAAILNSMNDWVLKRVLELSVFIHTVGTIALIVILLAVAPTKQSASFVFTSVENLTGQDNQAYAILLGFLMPAWTFVGFDASAHVSEETVNAHREAARGIINAVAASAVVGFLFLLGLLFSIQDINAVTGTALPLAFTQVLLDGCAGNVRLATFLSCIPMFGGMLGLTGTLTANSRMLYAFTRDNGFGHTLSKFLYWSSPGSRIPLRTLWFGATASNCLIAIGFGSSVALSAAASIATIGLTTAYVIPTFVKLTFARKSFKRGEFHLGAFSVPLGWISVVWVVLLDVLLCLPTSYPVTAPTFNFASVMIGGVTIFAGFFWIVDAHRWFVGPIPRLTEEELEIMERKAAEFKA